MKGVEFRSKTCGLAGSCNECFSTLLVFKCIFSSSCHNSLCVLGWWL